MTDEAVLEELEKILEPEEGLDNHGGVLLIILGILIAQSPSKCILRSPHIEPLVRAGLAPSKDIHQD